MLCHRTVHQPCLRPIATTAEVESGPCRAVSTAQVEGLGTKVVNAAMEGDQSGKSCVDLRKPEYGTANAGLAPGNKDGLSSRYASSEDGTLASLTPLSATRREGREKASAHWQPESGTIFSSL